MGKTLERPESGIGRRKSQRAADEPEPVWDIARLFPSQGAWSEDEYLALNGNQLVEFSDGYVEVLPMPTTAHQRIVRFLVGALLAFTASRKLGEVLFAPLRVRLWRRTYREPDVVFMLAGNAGRVHEEYWDAADLVMEVLSEGAADRRRDLERKRAEYARAKIPEYWIVDPRQCRITVLKLRGTRYTIHGTCGEGERAASGLVKGFDVEVDAAFAAARGG